MNKLLNEHLNDYLRFCEHSRVLRPATLVGYKNAFSMFSRLMPEISQPSDLSPEVIDVFFMRLRQRKRLVGRGVIKTGVTASTVRAYGSKLHSAFDWLCARGFLLSNPVDRGSLAKPQYTDKRALSRDEVDRIFAAIIQLAPNRFLLKRNLAMFNVLLFAGLRRKELLSLRLHDVDLDNKMLTVSAETSKSKFARVVPLTRETVIAIEDYLKERKTRRLKCGHLWVSGVADSNLTEYGLKKLVDATKARSGVSFHVHRFRHTYACMLGRKNVSAVKIQKLLGHSDLRMTQTYLRSLGVEDVRDSVQFLSLESLPSV